MTAVGDIVLFITDANKRSAKKHPAIVVEDKGGRVLNLTVFGPRAHYAVGVPFLTSDILGGFAWTNKTDVPEAMVDAIAIELKIRESEKTSKE